MSSRAYDAAIALIAQHITAAGGDQFEAVRAAYRAIEGRVLRAALERSGWSTRGAMRELGLKSPEAVRKALARHPELEAERQKRAR